MVIVDTRTALLDCAEQAVRARGYDGFSYADLAKAVGIRKPSIHYHFATKADLSLALIDRYSARFFASLDDIVATQSTSGARLAAFVAAYRRGLDGGDLLCLCVAFCINRDALSLVVLEKLDAFHMAVVRWLTDVFTASQVDGGIASVANPSDEAYACLAQLEGAQLAARAARKMARFDTATAGLMARLDLAG